MSTPNALRSATTLAADLQQQIPLADGVAERTAYRKPMRLADFIIANRAAILAEWEAFAWSCMPAAGSMGIMALSDHANEMLTVIAKDLNTPQGDYEQSEKSKGHAPPTVERTAA